MLKNFMFRIVIELLYRDQNVSIETTVGRTQKN